VRPTTKAIFEEAVDGLPPAVLNITYTKSRSSCDSPLTKPFSAKAIAADDGLDPMVPAVDERPIPMHRAGAYWYAALRPTYYAKRGMCHIDNDLADELLKIEDVYGERRKESSEKT
ncbi:hypothetical protein TELCIR_24504, partial [Teladorsagia circumcincta]